MEEDCLAVRKRKEIGEKQRIPVKKTRSVEPGLPSTKVCLLSPMLKLSKKARK